MLHFMVRGSSEGKNFVPARNFLDENGLGGIMAQGVQRYS